MRYLSPLLFLAAGGFAFHEATNGDDHFLAFPFIDAIVPSTAGDPAAMGRASAGLLAVLGVLLLLNAARRHVKEARQAEAAE